MVEWAKAAVASINAAQIPQPDSYYSTVRCARRWMKQLLPLEVVLDAAIKHRDFISGDMFVADNREHQRQFVQKLIGCRGHNKMTK
ncbi:putative uclease mut-7 [Phytophthora cinnamomi]|uniref:putative uclease mut-7 n=1 Tax=Phytophthora cinnamomi TaxID=4785 RepID=UPI00355A64E6|nr:putative uclease mut-7 [Phytophthora cinnamomi]